jgi:hypothetical protein
MEVRITETVEVEGKAVIVIAEEEDYWVVYSVVVDRTITGTAETAGEADQETVVVKAKVEVEAKVTRTLLLLNKTLLEVLMVRTTAQEMETAIVGEARTTKEAGIAMTRTEACSVTS